MRPHQYGNFILIFLFLTSSANPRGSKNTTAQQFMGPQNAAREAVGLLPLGWDRKLALYARQYARERHGDCALQHSNGPYGENIFWGSGSQWAPAQAAEAWVEERQYYDYTSNSCAFGEQCGHYTQIVWKNTTKIGCAKLVCDYNVAVFMICSYNPPGNYIGEKPY